MSTPDVLLASDHDLCWKKVGNGGWLYNGPVVFPAPDRYSRGEPRQKLGVVIGCVPDQSSKLWVFCWADAFTGDEKVTVDDHLVHVPLRFRGLVYEEGVSRAKNYLVDRLMPDITPNRRTDLAWGGNEGTGRWTLTVDGREWTFGPAESERGHTSVAFDDDMDTLQALAAAVKAVITETRGF